VSRHHEIPATPENLVRGYFDAALPPVLEIDSGGTVTLTAWMAGYRAQLHPDRRVSIPCTGGQSTGWLRARERTS
jgi:hypothetical protein